MSDAAFFSQKRAAAVLKHGILSRYVQPFATKTSSASTGGRVVVLDGYAGEGRYEDGSPGSPIFMAEAARKMPTGRTLQLLFVEEKKPRVERLREVLAEEADGVDWTVEHTSVEKYLDTALGTADGVPFFAFLDPCGLGLTFDDIVSKIYARPRGLYSPGTEILVNFSADAVRRIGGRLVKESEGASGREATLARMDAACGGDWWRDAYRGAADNAEAVGRIAEGYLDRLLTATKAGGWVFDVKNSEHQQARYSLVFLTRHSDGLMIFGEALSGAQEEWRKALAAGTLLGEPDALKSAEAELKAKWVAQLKDNIRAVVADSPRFKVRTKYAEVMGDLAGTARMTHLRAALKELKAEGVLASDGKGNPLWDQTVESA